MATDDTIVEAIARVLAIALNQITQNITSSIYAQGQRKKKSDVMC